MEGTEPPLRRVTTGPTRRGRPYPHGLRGSRCRWLFPLPSDKIFSGENGLLLDAVLTRNTARAITRRRNCPQHRGQRGSKNSGPSCQAFQSSARTVQVAESRASSRTRDHPSCRPPGLRRDTYKFYASDLSVSLEGMLSSYEDTTTQRSGKLSMILRFTTT